MTDPEQPANGTEQDETVEESGAGYGNNAGTQGEAEDGADDED